MQIPGHDACRNAQRTAQGDAQVRETAARQWHPVADHMAAYSYSYPPQRTLFTDGHAARLYFRVHLIDIGGAIHSTSTEYSEPWDNDGDGLPNWFETVYGTLTDDADSDNNGTPDGEEDPDGDGLDNATEYANKTDPQVSDTSVEATHFVLEQVGSAAFANGELPRLCFLGYAHAHDEVRSSGTVSINEGRYWGRYDEHFDTGATVLRIYDQPGSGNYNDGQSADGFWNMVETLRADFPKLRQLAVLGEQEPQRESTIAYAGFESSAAASHNRSLTPSPPYDKMDYTLESTNCLTIRAPTRLTGPTDFTVMVEEKRWEKKEEELTGEMPTVPTDGSTPTVTNKWLLTCHFVPGQMGGHPTQIKGEVSGAPFEIVNINDNQPNQGKAIRLNPRAEKYVVKEVNLSLLPIEIKWEAISGNVDDNPDPWTNQTNGKRIIVGATEADHNGDMHRELNVRVSIPGHANQPVYLKVFDVDDPSQVSDDQVLDPNGAAGDDNMHAVGLGDNWGHFIPQAAKKITVNLDSSGEATVQFKVNQQPGNNYRVAVAIKDADLNMLQVSSPGGQGFVTANHNAVSGFSGAITPMLTVWRTLYIETDSMAAPTTPRDSPDRVDAVGDHWGWDPYMGQNRAQLFLAGSLPEGNNFYQRGRLKAGGAEYKIIESGSNSVTLSGSMQSFPSGFIGPVEIFDDDDRDLPGPPLPKTGLITQGLKDIYKRAYIDVRERTQNPNKTIPFKLYTSVVYPLLADSSLNDAIDTDGDDTGAFWNHYVIASYQPHKSKANDPSGAVTEGATMPTGYGPRYSVIFVETIRDAEAGISDLNIGRFNTRLDEIVAHEIGHVPNDPGSFLPDSLGGLSHPETGLMGDGAPQHHFSAESLKRLRQVYRWQDP